MSKTIYTAENYNLFWADAEETILQLDITSQWSWTDAYEIMGRMDTILEGRPYWVYSLYNFYPNVRTIPSGNPLTHLSYLVSQEQPNERLIVFVRSSLFLSRLLSVTGVVGRDSNLSKMRFVRNLGAGLEIIEQDKEILLPYKRSNNDE